MALADCYRDSLASGRGTGHLKDLAVLPVVLLLSSLSRLQK